MAAPPSRPSGKRSPFSLSIDPSDRLLPSGGDRHGRTGGDEPPPPPPRRASRPPKPPKPPGPRKPARKGGDGKPWPRRVAVWVLTLMIWVGIGLGGVVAYYAIDLPDIDRMTAQTRRPSVVFQSVEGEVFAAFGDLYGEPLDLPEMSPFIIQAVLATEDRRFFSHWGFDPIGLARALVTNFRAGHAVQGGSTITQQLAKNLFLTPERNLKRKVQELLMALWLEKRFSKDQILALYLNRVYFGSGTFGVDAAAKRYFDVSARRVDLYQAALIAGLLKAPSRYSPINDPEASRLRTADVLQNMVNAGYIDPKTAETVQVTGAAQLVRRQAPAGRYFADWVMNHLDQFGEVAGKDIIVRTTLDMSLQRKVEASLATMMEGPGAKANASQGAVVVMSPDGAVRALTGGKDYDDSQFNRATQGLRQPGSSFKPFVYLAAMEKGLTPDDVFEDAPIKLGNWSPGNYTGKYLGPVTLRQALAESINTVAVRLVENVGPNRVIATARRLGITSDLRNDATLALGTSEVSLVELTGAYASFANGGMGVSAYAVSQITDPGGRLLYQRQGGGFGQVISPAALARMHDMMGAVISNGSGKAAKLDRPAAGKTGTTQDYRDAWFMGFTADYVAGVWMGNDDYRIEMKKVTGGGLPAQLWKQVMTAAHRGLPVRPLPTPQPPAAPESGPAIGEEIVDGVAQAGADAARGIGSAIDDLLKGIFGR
ncbi:Membrane carboxypeptidase [Candidatus Terasakiella magnetica]|nr:Membrane carboxypeptidase [Candidatus Terasakiella magnetica]